MRGICLDRKALQEGLFQTVIQYKIKDNGEAVIILPKTAFRPDIRYIKKYHLPDILMRNKFLPAIIQT